MTNEDIMEIDLFRLAQVLWNRVWAIIAAAFLSGAVMAACTIFFIAPKYQADILLYVSSTAQEDARRSISQSELTAAQSLADTCIVILNSRNMLNDVIGATGISCDWEALSRMIRAESVDETAVLRIEAVSTSPREAEDIANAIARMLPEKMAAIEEGGTVSVVDTAVAARQISPSLFWNTLLAVVAGIFLSSGVIAGKVLLDDKIRDADYLTGTFGFPVLTVIPDRKARPGPGNGMAFRLDDGVAQACRKLGSNIQLSMPDVQGCRTIGVTSSQRGEGKTTTAMHLARALAQTGQRVLLLEADFRKPDLADWLWLSPEPGLTNLLAGQCPAGVAMQCTARLEAVWCLAAGSIPPDAGTLLASRQMESVLHGFGEQFDAVIVDMPPVTEAEDVVTLSRLLSGIVVVSRQNVGRRSAMEEAMEKLKDAQCKIIGFAVTGGVTRRSSPFYK